MRVAITGASGLLGRALVPLLASHGHHVVAGFHQEVHGLASAADAVQLDLLDAVSISKFVDRAQANWTIHTAALTDVDRCEREPELAQALNTDATARLADAVVRASGRMVFLSTDYVFDGREGPYDERAVPGPVNCYGRTKLAAERIVESLLGDHVIIRSGSFLGMGTPGHPTWVENIAATILHNPPLSAPTDQRSNITPVEFLASAIVDIIERGQLGLRHIAGDRILSRYDFAVSLARLFDLGGHVVRAVHYQDIKRPAQRPLMGGLVSRYPELTPQIPLEKALLRWKQAYLQRHM